jgi:hypothetical protein
MQVSATIGAPRPIEEVTMGLNPTVLILPVPRRGHGPHGVVAEQIPQHRHDKH